MLRLRRRTLTIAIALAALSGCEPVGQAGLGPDVRRGLQEGRDAAGAWISDARLETQVSDEAVIALGYIERLRLGLGSPFRLMDQALSDPRLDPETRRTLAWSLLARTVDRLSYQIDEVALDRVGLGGIDLLPMVGRHHLKIIENAVRESSDPRSGELAVRLAYTLATAEGSLPARAPDLAARAAALVRDRELAREDALRLLRAAESAGDDPLRLVQAWRAERKFAVEQPPMAVLSQASELHAMELAPRLARGLRELSLQLDQIRASRQRPAPAPAGVLSATVATRLIAIADSFNAPPQAPMGIAARLYRRELLEGVPLADDQRAAREEFIARATSEEQFVAHYASLSRRSAGDVGAALAAVAAATGLRPFGQEQVWFPGFGGPTARELEERYGISVRFGSELPAAWRPYFRRMIDVALTDLQRVLPALDVRGLTVLYADQAGQPATLAMHDPKARRLLFPPGTTAGTIAHEVAHDLDWQVALRRYRVRGDYATDRAARSQDRLAMRVQDLANGSLEPTTSGGGNRLSTHARRPAEVFARNVDWFVAVSLAAQGRMNGYLSSVQDDMLTGYGTVRPPDVTGAAGDALVNILDDVAPLYPATREWFLKSYGLNRSLTPYDLTRRVVEVAAEEEPARVQLDLTSSSQTAVRFASVARARATGLAAIDSWICRSPAAAYNRELERARRALVVEAAAARARGMAITHARELAGPVGAQWMRRELFGAQWPGITPDSAVITAIAPLAADAQAVAVTEVVGRTTRFDLVRPPERCAAAPLRVY